MIEPMEPPMSAEQKLPFPTRPLRIGADVVEEYIIPDNKKEEVLQLLYLFENVPSLDDERFDLHEEKMFVVRDFRVTWEDGQNWLVSPYYPSSGGTVIDWMPPDFEDEYSEDDDSDKDDSVGDDDLARPEDEEP